MKIYIYSFFVGLLIVLSPFISRAQLTIPVYHQMEQDLCHAFVICSDTFFNYKSYKGVGLIWESLPGANPFGPSSPMPGGGGSLNVEDSLRENSHWITMKIAESGNLAFDLIPLNSGDFYQILVFKGTEACNTPSGFNLVRYAENKKDLFSAPTFNITGIKAATSETTKNKATPLWVNAGEIYYIRILGASKYVEVNPILTTAVPVKAGYTIDFSSKTCKFEIGPPPLMAEILGNGCDNGSYIDILLNRNVDCSSIEINGTDFTLGGSGTITGALGSGCSFGVGITNEIRLFYDGIIPPGFYNIHVQEGTDGNTLLDVCYQESPFPQMLSYEVQKLKDTTTIYICTGSFPYDWNGIMLNDTGTMITSFVTDNSRGCDSTTYLNIYTVDSFVHEEDVYACDEIFPIVWHGGLSTSSYGENVLRYVFTAQGGCDSIVYLNVYPQPIDHIDSHVVACESFEIDGIVFEESGFYIDTITTDLGCISTVINFDIDVFAPVLIERVVIDTGSCSHMYIGDRLIYKDSVIVDTLKTWFGCDSAIVQYNVDITANIEPDVNRYFVSVCDSFVVNEIKVDTDTVLKFLFRNQYNCDSVLNIYYVTIDTLDLELIALPQRPVKGEVVKIYAGSSQPNLTIHYWTPENLFPQQNAPDQILVITEPLTVSVMATDSRGCVAIDTLIISEVDTLLKFELIPNAFSPNGDGLNDVFNIELPNERGREVVALHIYDRWGKLVYSDYGNNNFQWNGQYGNSEKAAPNGVYYFQMHIKYIDNEEKVVTGDITLLR